MAVTTIVTPKPKRSVAVNSLPNVNSVMTKTVTFDVPTGTAGNGYYTGDTILLKNVVPKGCDVTGVYVKVSADQGATLTFAPRLYATGDTSRTAFVTARALNLTAGVNTSLVVVPGTGSVNTIATADSDVAILLAGTTVGTTAGTIQLTLVMNAIDSEAAQYTTYTV